jgi:hypothetical protein
MKLPRPRIWLLMLVVALAALGKAGWVLVKRSREYSLLARQHASAEKLAGIIRDSFQGLREPKTKSIQSTRAHIDRIDARIRQCAPDSSALELLRRQRADAKEDLNGTLKALHYLERGAEEYSNEAASEHRIAATYRRAARYPWLGPPRIESPPPE